MSGRRRSGSNSTKNRYAYPIVKRDKYSIETTFLTGTASNDHSILKLRAVPPTDVQGMRKVKHLEVTLAAAGSSPCVWALVYVPQLTIAEAGLTLNTANLDSLYEPNQFCMMSGTTDFSSGVLRFRTPIARNLNAGDAIVLLIKNLGTQSLVCNGTVRYAITLQ